MGAPVWAQLGRCFPHPENICRARRCSGTDPCCFAGPTGPRGPAASACLGSPGGLLGQHRQSPVSSPTQKVDTELATPAGKRLWGQLLPPWASSGGCKACCKVGMVHLPSPHGNSGDNSLFLFLCHIWPLTAQLQAVLLTLDSLREHKSRIEVSTFVFN